MDSVISPQGLTLKPASPQRGPRVQTLTAGALEHSSLRPAHGEPRGGHGPGSGQSTGKEKELKLEGGPNFKTRRGRHTRVPSYQE